ncbi:mobile mystery protein B [Thermodesulfobacteriota bacterium]
MDIQYPDGATPLDADETEGLLLTHITTREELNRWEQQNITEAEDWAFGRKQKSILSQGYICRLHKKMFGNVWKWAGQFRKSMKNLGIEPWRIASETGLVCEDATAWIDHETYSADEIATRLHHKLVWIHPFANGNGRHARMMADIVLVQGLETKPFTWGSLELIKPGESRSKYIKALQAADNHDFTLLLEFVRS